MANSRIGELPVRGSGQRALAARHGFWGRGGVRPESALVWYEVQQETAEGNAMIIR